MQTFFRASFCFSLKSSSFLASSLMLCASWRCDRLTCSVSVKKKTKTCFKLWAAAPQNNWWLQRHLRNLKTSSDRFSVLKRKKKYKFRLRFCWYKLCIKWINHKSLYVSFLSTLRARKNLRVSDCWWHNATILTCSGPLWHEQVQVTLHRCVLMQRKRL